MVATKSIEAICFTTYPGCVTFMQPDSSATFMRPYVKTRDYAHMRNHIDAFGYPVLDGMVIHDDYTPAQIKNEVEKWKKAAYKFVGVPVGLYWSTSKIGKVYDAKIMDIVRNQLVNGLIPTHNAIVLGTVSHMKCEEILHSIGDTNLDPKAFHPIKKKDIDFVAKDCLEHILSLRKEGV